MHKVWNTVTNLSASIKRGGGGGEKHMVDSLDVLEEKTNIKPQAVLKLLSLLLLKYIFYCGITWQNSTFICNPEKSLANVWFFNSPKDKDVMS